MARAAQSMHCVRPCFPVTGKPLSGSTIPTVPNVFNLQSTTRRSSRASEQERPNELPGTRRSWPLGSSFSGARTLTGNSSSLSSSSPSPSVYPRASHDASSPSPSHDNDQEATSLHRKEQEPRSSTSAPGPFPEGSPESSELLPDLAAAEEAARASVDQVLDSEASKLLLQDLAAAELRVLRAREEMRQLQERERELERIRAELEVQERAEAELAEAESKVADLEWSVAAAEEAVRLAGANLIQARAGLTTQTNPVGGSFLDDAERTESIKAGAIAGATGAASYLLFLLTAASAPSAPIFPEAAETWLGWHGATALVVTVLTCALMGITYRYTVRADVADNLKLKSGVVGAFAVVQGMARLDAVFGTAWQANAWDIMTPALGAAVDAGEGALALLFGALVLEACLQRGILHRFPSQRNQ